MAQVLRKQPITDGDFDRGGRCLHYSFICGCAIVRNWKRPSLLNSQVSEISMRPWLSKCEAGFGKGALFRNDANAVVSVPLSWLERMISLRIKWPPASTAYFTTITERNSACGRPGYTLSALTSAMRCAKILLVTSQRQCARGGGRCVFRGACSRFALAWRRGDFV